MLRKIIFILLIFSIRMNAQNVKIYSIKDTIFWNGEFPNEVYWGFYKVDMENKILQHKSFSLIDGDSIPVLTNLFKDSSASIDKFVISRRTRKKIKIKIPKTKGRKVKRVWYDLATSGRAGGKDKKIFYIEGNNFYEKNSKFKFYLDKILTKKIIGQK